MIAYKHILFILMIFATVIVAAKEAAPKNRISEQAAKEIALSAFKGSVKSSELEVENQKWVYSFDIVDKFKRVREIHVDAKTGQIVLNEIEMPEKSGGF